MGIINAVLLTKSSLFSAVIRKQAKGLFLLTLNIPSLVLQLEIFENLSKKQKGIKKSHTKTCGNNSDFLGVNVSLFE